MTPTPGSPRRHERHRHAYRSAALTGLCLWLQPALMAGAGEPAPGVPLEVGLMVVSATHDEANGIDYEVFSSITVADETGVTSVLRRRDPLSHAKADEDAISVTHMDERRDLAEHLAPAMRAESLGQGY